MPRLTDQLLHSFRDKVHEGDRICKLYRNRAGKNKWNIICSAMDWIQVTVAGIDTDTLIRENSDEASRRMISFVSYIDVMWEGICQLHRVLFNTSYIPFMDDHSIFNQEKDDNNHFKTIRAVFAAHPVNLYEFKPDKAYASWSGGGIGHGDFSAIIYSNNADKEHETFDITFDELFRFAEKRYQYLTVLSAEIDKQIAADNEKWQNEIIPDRTEDILSHIELLKAENEKRFDNAWIKMRLEEIQMAFSTRITDEENEKAVDRYRQALITDLDYIQTCLQTMSFDDDHQDVEGECPPNLTYARSQISELDYGLFWPAVREMSSYLASVVDLGKADNMYEIQVLVEAGLWLKNQEKLEPTGETRMSVDLKLLQQKLAEYKVYDAWQYVEGLIESIRYAHLSKQLAEKLFEHRRDTIQEVTKQVVPGTNGGVTLYTPIGSNPYQTIVGVDIDDALLMSKSVLDFFHYARMSVEIVAQILNAALFGDEAVSSRDKGIIKKVVDKIGEEPSFTTISTIISRVTTDHEIKYLMAFDNYAKHVKNPSFLIKNGFVFSNEATFRIKAFDTYSDEDAIAKVDTVFNAVESYVNDVLDELLNQIANGRGRNNRFQTVSFKAQFRETEHKSYVDFVSFFIEVEHGIQDLPTQISVLPLAIDNEGKVTYKLFPIDKIFITLIGKEEQGICGVAELIAGQDSTELYQKFNVRGCSEVD